MKIKNKQWRWPRKNYYEHIRDAIGLVLVKARTWREKKTRTRHNTMHALRSDKDRDTKKRYTL